MIAQIVNQVKDFRYSSFIEYAEGKGLLEMLVVKAKVCGKAREISRAEVAFSAKILRNGTEARYESNAFRDGDDFYLLFKSPVNGFLAVYLIDDKQTAYCLLPYPGNASGKTPVEHAKEYIFFSQKMPCLQKSVW